MKPGGELDALVAEKVMGHDFVRTRHEWAPLDEPEYLQSTYRCTRCGECSGWLSEDELSSAVDCRIPVPPYSTSIASAWEVVGWVVWGRYGFKADDPGYYMSDAFDLWFDKQWWAAFGNHSHVARADTAPHAICLAALKAVG